MATNSGLMIHKKKFAQCNKNVQVWHKNVCTVHHARSVFTSSPNASVHNLKKDF